MEKHFSLRPAMLLKGKARGVEEMALMYRNPGVQALPASSSWYGTESSREAYAVLDGNTLPCSPRRFRTGMDLDLSLDTQIVVTSPDKSGDQVSCYVKEKCQSFASRKQNMTGF